MRVPGPLLSTPWQGCSELPQSSGTEFQFLKQAARADQYPLLLPFLSPQLALCRRTPRPVCSAGSRQTPLPLPRNSRRPPASRPPAPGLGERREERERIPGLIRVAAMWDRLGGFPSAFRDYL